MAQGERKKENKKNKKPFSFSTNKFQGEKRKKLTCFKLFENKNPKKSEFAIKL